MKFADKMLERVRLHDSYRRVFNEPDGKVILKHLMKLGFVTRSIFCRDPQEMAYRAGQRDLVLAIMSFVTKDTEALITEIEKTLEEV